MPGIKDSGADPKDKIQVVNLLHRAEMLAEEMHYAEAVPLLEQAIANEPRPAHRLLAAGHCSHFPQEL